MNQSKEFYFKRGDVVLRVGDTTFKLHKDILESHSEYFRGVFSAPSADATEGTDENPLHLPQDLCSLDAFKHLCRMMYPSVMGSPPLAISLALLAIWEPVLNATKSLQMSWARASIFASLAKSHSPSHSPSILSLCSRNEDAPKIIKFSAFRTLAYRRQPMSREETMAMGIEAAHQVGYIREMIRVKIGCDSAFPVYLHKLCTTRERCVEAFILLLRQNMQARTGNGGDRGWDDIFQFQDLPNQGMCPMCVHGYPLNVKATQSMFVDKIISDFIFQSPEKADAPSDPLSDTDAGLMDPEKRQSPLIANM